MKRALIPFLVLLVAASVRAELRLLNAVVVIVNDSVVTYQDLQDFIGPEMERIARKYPDQPILRDQEFSKARAEAVEQLVERKLILHDFKTAGYNLPESVIDDQISERIKRRHGDRATLIKSLHKNGQTFDTFRQHAREDFIVEQMQYFHVSKDIIISPQKISDYYEANKTNYAVADQVKLRMIVLNKPPGSDGAAVKQLATDILGKIREGAAFEEMARIHSEGSQRLDGGSWGWVERSVLRKELGDVAFALPKGKVSDVIDLPDGCFIMLVEDNRIAYVKPLTELQDEIEKNLLIKERARLQKKFIDRLKTKSFVRYF